MPLITDYTAGTFACPGLCSADASSTKTFYSALLGWEAHDMSMDDGDFTMFKVGGEAVAGMYQMPEDRKAAGVKPHWNAYLGVADVEEITKKAERLGGKVLMQPFEAGGDLMANLQDPTGANFSIWQISKQSEASLLNEPGALCWTELCTSDTAAASAFYSELLDWRPKPFEGSPMPYTVFDLGSEGCGVAGMMEIGEEMGDMQNQWLPYFMVEDADKTAALARELGGQVHGPMDIPSVGRIAMINDTQGSAFAVIKPTVPVESV